ncbi:molybdopterin-dependent oxidoreductase [Hydrogenophaga sp. OTU3427]|uniref:molybdopterin-dependent oxidoreductase n=1 Tax=Hydrogenophaga sp. OTU3427 TaxID=3043856 RepID=UPI00313AD8E6
MKKRDFLALASTAAALPVGQAWAAERPATQSPALLTVGGPVGKGNRGPLDVELDQMLFKHGVKFSTAFAFDAPALMRLARVTIRPTLEYDNKVHALSGPLLTTVLRAAGVRLAPGLRLGLRAVDGYNVVISLADAEAYQMMVATHIDGQAMALGGLGPQWAVYDADRLPAFKDKPVKERFGLCPWGLYYIDVSQG